MSEIKQAINQFKIIGTLKTKSLEKTKVKDSNVIRGFLIIEVKEKQKVHNHRVNIYAREKTMSGNTSKQYKGFQTVMNEYIAKDDNEDEASYVEVKGNIDYNVYKTQFGEINENNRLRTNSVHRVDKEKPQQSKAVVEVITDTYKTEMKNGEPTGYQLVNGLTVGYKGHGIKLPNLKSKSEKDLSEIIPEHTTIKATIQLNNYIVVSEKKKTKEDLLFGDTEEEEVVENHSFVNNFRLAVARMSEHQYSEEDIKAIKKNIQNSIKEAEAKDNKPKKKKKPEKDLLSGEQIDISEDDLPF